MVGAWSCGQHLHVLHTQTHTHVQHKCCHSRGERRLTHKKEQRTFCYRVCCFWEGEQWQTGGKLLRYMSKVRFQNALISEPGGCNESSIAKKKKKWMWGEKSEIWQVGCRAVSKRDTSFSAWPRDNDEPQIRMNEKVLRNLSATLQRLMLCQGCWTHITIFPQKMLPTSHPCLLHLQV